jgi:hypothetical protein
MPLADEAGYASGEAEVWALEREVEAHKGHRGQAHGSLRITDSTGRGDTTVGMVPAMSGHADRLWGQLLPGAGDLVSTAVQGRCRAGDRAAAKRLVTSPLCVGHAPIVTRGVPGLSVSSNSGSSPMCTHAHRMSPIVGLHREICLSTSWSVREPTT